MASASASAVASSAPRVTPTVSQAVRVDWGSWASQALAAEAKVIEAAANAGLNLALAQIPFGSMIEMFIGPQVIDGYIEQGLVTLEGMLSKLEPLVASNTLETYVFNALNAFEPQLAAMLSDKLGPLISAGVAKVLGALGKSAPPASASAR